MRIFCRILGNPIVENLCFAKFTLRRDERLINPRDWQNFTQFAIKCATTSLPVSAPVGWKRRGGIEQCTADLGFTVNSSVYIQIFFAVCESSFCSLIILT